MSADSPPLVIGVLGEVTASVGGRPVDLGGPRQRAVLAVLVAARGDIVPTARLIDSVWPDRPPANAAGAVQAYVSHLRRALEPDRTARDRQTVIAHRPPGYTLAVPVDAVDAWRFERLADEAGSVPALTAALGLWQGPAYAGYADQPWARAEAARLTELRELVRDRLMAARLAVGEDAALVAELEAMVAADPLREERWRLLVLALYRAHRQGDALAALRSARRTLAEELGVDPGPALRELEADVLAQAPTLNHAPASPPGSPAPPPGSAPPEIAPPGMASVPGIGTTAPAGRRDGLVDRDREVAELAAATAGALVGEARFVLVEGPAGIGKSRLLAEARRLAADRGALVLSGRGSQLEREFGFGVVRQLFEALLVDPVDSEKLLSGAAGAAASVFDLTASGGEHTYAVLHGLYWLTANVAAGRPLTLLVDDLQWCDSGSLRYLAYLQRRLDGLPLLVVAALRTGEQADDTLLDELRFDPDTTVLRPGSLGRAAVGELVRRGLGADAEDGFVAACHRTTSGNPLLLRQLLRALESNRIRPTAAHSDTVTAIGSRAVAGMVLIRLRRMPPATTAVARAVAVLGDGAGLPPVAELAGVSEAEAAAAVAALARAEVVRQEYPVAFVHPLVRDAVYHDLPPGERQLHHERAARALVGAGAPPEQVAAHLLQIPQRGEASVVDTLRAAAARATTRGAPDSAAAYLRRALAEPPAAGQRSVVLLELGLAETLSHGPMAVQHLREAYDDPRTDPATAAEVARVLLHTLLFTGPYADFAGFARAAVARVGPEFPDHRQAVIALERTGTYMHTGDPTTVTGLEPVPSSGDGLGARMLDAARAWELTVAGRDRAGAVRLARRALAGGVLVREEPGLFWVVAGTVLEIADEDTGSFWDDALAIAHTRGSLFSVLAAHLWRGHWAWLAGDLLEAQQSLLAANEQNVRWGGIPATGISYGEAFLIELLVDRGAYADARAFYEQVRPRPRTGDGARLFDHAHTRLLLAEGDPAAALTVLDRRAGELTWAANPAWFAAPALRARALHALGRTAEARELAAGQVTAARRWGAPTTVGRALLLAGELGDGPDAAGALHDAVAVLAGTRSRLHHARALAALARALPPGAERVDAWRSALALADTCGALGMRRDIAGELGRAGAPVPPPARAAPTATHRRIAAMAAEGIDERGIAEALFLTPAAVRAVLADLK